MGRWIQVGLFAALPLCAGTALAQNDNPSMGSTQGQGDLPSVTGQGASGVDSTTPDINSDAQKRANDKTDNVPTQVPSNPMDKGSDIDTQRNLGTGSSSDKLDNSTDQNKLNIDQNKLNTDQNKLNTDQNKLDDQNKLNTDQNKIDDSTNLPSTSDKSMNIDKTPDFDQTTSESQTHKKTTKTRSHKKSTSSDSTDSNLNK